MPSGRLNGLLALGVVASDKTVRAPDVRSTAMTASRLPSVTKARLLTLSTAMPSGRLNGLLALGVVALDNTVRIPVVRSTATTATRRPSLTKTRLLAVSKAMTPGAPTRACRSMTTSAAWSSLFETLSPTATVRVFVPGVNGTIADQVANSSLVEASTPLTRRNAMVPP